MADLWRVEDWRLPAQGGVLYERLLSALGSEDFGATVRHCAEAVTAGLTRLYLFHTGCGDTDALAYVHCEPRIAELLPAYTQLYRRLDPIADAYAAALGTGDLAVQRVRPADIASAGFRRRFFEEPGIVERISFIQRSPGGWRGLNIARHADTGPFSERELDALGGLARLALPMLRVRTVVPAAAVPAVGVIEERFARHWPSLTRREQQVCARAVLGMSVPETAKDLAIAPSSVVTFRQRAYRRLGIGRAAELTGLVMS